MVRELIAIVAAELKLFPESCLHPAVAGSLPSKTLSAGGGSSLSWFGSFTSQKMEHRSEIDRGEAPDVSGYFSVSDFAKSACARLRQGGERRGKPIQQRKLAK
jgi:hypothetical protein